MGPRLDGGEFLMKLQLFFIFLAKKIIILVKRPLGAL